MGVDQVGGGGGGSGGEGVGSVGGFRWGRDRFSGGVQVVEGVGVHGVGVLFRWGNVFRWGVEWGEGS